MSFDWNKFILITNYLKNAALILLVAFITVKCDVLDELTREPLPRAGTSRPTPESTEPLPEVKPSAREDASFRNDIVTYAKKFKGTKYKYAGVSPKTGFDCSGFTHYVMDNFDIQLSRSSRAQAAQGTSKSVKDVEPGDLIFFRRSKKDPIFHVAMVVANDGRSLYVIHSTSRGVVIDDILASSYWRPKIDSGRDVVSGMY